MQSLGAASSIRLLLAGFSAFAHRISFQLDPVRTMDDAVKNDFRHR